MIDKQSLTNLPYYDEIRRYCARLLHSEIDGEDAAQEVFTRWFQYGEYMEGLRLRRWLFKVARNLINDILRKRMSKHSEIIISDDERTSLTDTPDKKFADPVAAVEQQDLIQNVLSEVSKFDQRTRDIVNLSFFHGKTSSEIGTQFKMSDSNVRRIIGKFLERIREHYKTTELTAEENRCY